MRNETWMLALRRILFLEGIEKGLEAGALHDYIESGIRLARFVRHLDRERDELKVAG